MAAVATALPLVLCLPQSVPAQQTGPVTVKGLKTPPGLAATLWAAEPLVVNPTNIDIDEKGRVWYLEAINYRRKLKGLPDLREGGDRIVILEDTNGDGRADKRTVFDESPELRSPLGIAVLGDRVYVSQSPHLWVYTRDAQDKVIRKELLFTGWGGIDHDHGLHAIKFGPDGRLYFNAGDQGFDLVDKDGRQWVSSKKGPYYAGTALRMNMDGTGFTVLAHNFRNPYELALDSFGSIWQSDNDDDGNAWTRFNFVMPGGNYGYWGPGGRTWREDRSTHFHGENPGVVPNMARLGAGSPCGLVIYEGALLPARYRGQPIHAEAGKRGINTYLISDDGAGYGLKVENTVAGEDTWFRPSDVAVSPDGALYVSDWYDPGVGGHNMGDTERGRIYRIAPPGHRTMPVKVDLETPAGLTAAFRSPNQAIRHLAYVKLRSQGQAALPALTAMWKGADAVMRARSLWLLGALGREGRTFVSEALASPDARFRILGLRVLDLHFPDEFAQAAKPLWSDRSAQVRREIAVLLRNYPLDQSGDALEALARQFDGKDRWYLEALGIGMTGKESAMAERFRAAFGGRMDERYARLLWRLRVPESLDQLSRAARDGSLSEPVRTVAAEALTEINSGDAVASAAALVANPSVPATVRRAALDRMNRRLFSEWTPHRGAAPVTAMVSAALATNDLRKSALALAEELEDPQFAPALAKMANDATLDEETRAAAISAVGRSKEPKHADLLEKLAAAGSALPIRTAAIRAMGSLRPPGLDARFRQLLVSKDDNAVRSEALRVLARSSEGAGMVLDLEQAGELPAELRTLAGNLTNQSRDPKIRERAAKLLPPPAGRDQSKINFRSIPFQQGDAASGRKVFMDRTNANCAGCHALEPNKATVGPNLAAIGDKLGKEALLDSILNPSAGIAHEYVAWVLETKTQGQVIGILAEDTPQRVVVKNEQGEEVRLRPADITDRRKSSLSMMPEDLVTKMTEADLVNLLEFLTTLKEHKRAAR